jgi:hypothetical protein
VTFEELVLHSWKGAKLREKTAGKIVEILQKKYGGGADFSLTRYYAYAIINNCRRMKCV